MSENIYLICPECQLKLLEFDSLYHCGNCNSNYPIKEGVVCFHNESDDFYEHFFDIADYASKGTFPFKSNFTYKRTLKSLLHLYFAEHQFLWYIQKHVKQTGKILDVACGPGKRYLAQKGEVTGIDLSFRGLKETTEFYKLSIQADALRMPFPEAAYDVVTCCFGFEHFKPDVKYLLLNQFYRVLKPGGKIILLFDCDSNNPLFRWVKRNPELYKENFVERPDHYGLQMPSENMKLIENSGFKIIECHADCKTPFQDAAFFGWLKPYGEVSKLAALASYLVLYADKYRPTRYCYEAFVTFFDDIIEKFLPLDWARLLLVVAQKG